LKDIFSGRDSAVKKSHSPEKQIALALHQAEISTPAAAIIRKMGVGEQTFYREKRPA
jgi:hypothetical protein